MTASRTIHTFSDIDFETPGKRHYEVAFHHDGTWGNVLVPLTVIRGQRGPGTTVAVFGGTTQPLLKWMLHETGNPLSIAI